MCVCDFPGVIGDVCFSPLSADGATVFASVGDDRHMMVWDARSGSDPVLKVRASSLYVCVRVCLVVEIDITRHTGSFPPSIPAPRVCGCVGVPLFL